LDLHRNVLTLAIFINIPAELYPGIRCSLVRHRFFCPCYERECRFSF